MTVNPRLCISPTRDLSVEIGFESLRFDLQRGKACLQVRSLVDDRDGKVGVEAGITVMHFCDLANKNMRSGI